MTNIIKITAMALLSLPLASEHYAQAAETTVITLSCDGTMTAMVADANPEPANKMGVVVNLAEHTVSFGAYVVKIDSVGAADVTFSGESKIQAFGNPAVSVSIMGDLDRVTGHLVATQFSTAAGFNFDLICKPATRLF